MAQQTDARRRAQTRQKSLERNQLSGFALRFQQSDAVSHVRRRDGEVVVTLRKPMADDVRSLARQARSELLDVRRDGDTLTVAAPTVPGVEA